MERVWKGSWLRAVAAGAGLALVMLAVMLSSRGPAAHAQTATPVNTSTPTATNTPTATPVCDLGITKDITDSTVPEGGTADYTITVTNNGDNDCTPRMEVSDVIPSDTDCSDASVDSSSDISDSHFTIDGCDTSGTVTWHTDTTLNSGDSIVLDMSLDLTSGASDGDHITNEACITEPSNLGCDSARLTVTGATATPTTAPTATPGTPTATVVVVLPTLRPTTPPLGGVAPTISVPVTGTGSSGGGSSPWPLALGALGGLLVLGSGVVLAKRTR